MATLQPGLYGIYHKVSDNDEWRFIQAAVYKEGAGDGGASSEVAEEIKTQVEALETSVNAANAGVTTANNNITALGNRVTPLESGFTATNGTVTTLSGKVGTLETGLTTTNGNVTALTNRVKTLENKPDTIWGANFDGTIAEVPDATVASLPVGGAIYVKKG